MREEWKKQSQFLKLGAGAFCISIGYAIWIPFVISDKLGGAEAPCKIQLTGMLLLVVGAALLLWGLKVKRWKEWVKLFLFFGFLQVCLSLVSGLLALLALYLSGDNGRIAKEAADYGSIILALPLHAWMLCLAGYICKKEQFSFWFPPGLFLQLLLLCSLAAICQLFLSWIPRSTAGILAQGLLGGCMLFGILCLMLKLTDRYLSGKHIQEQGVK